MDRRLTLAFVAILILLGGYIWYTFLRAGAPPVTPSTPEPTAILFLQVPQDQIQAVQVQNVKANKTTRVVRDADKWKMEQPAQGPADFSRVDEFTFGLGHVNAQRKLAAPADLAPFGLNPPQYQVKLEMQNSTVVTVNLGNQNSASSSFYASKDGDTAVYLVDSATGNDIKNFIDTPPYTPTPTSTPAPAGTPEPSATP